MRSLALILTASAAFAQAPARARTDSLLDAFVGTWNVTGTTRGKTTRYRMEARRVLQNKYVELHLVDVMSKPPGYEARVIIGEAAEPGQYIAHWIDNFGAKYSVPTASGKQVDDTLFLDFPYPDGAFHDTFSYDRKRRSWHMLLESADGNGWKVFADYDARRAGVPRRAANPTRATSAARAKTKTTKRK
jgi:hypothetical protein